MASIEYEAKSAEKHNFRLAILDLMFTRFRSGHSKNKISIGGGGGLSAFSLSGWVIMSHAAASLEHNGSSSQAAACVVKVFALDRQFFSCRL